MRSFPDELGCMGRSQIRHERKTRPAKCVSHWCEAGCTRALDRRRNFTWKPRTGVACQATAAKVTSGGGRRKTAAKKIAEQGLQPELQVTLGSAGMRLKSDEPWNTTREARPCSECFLEVVAPLGASRKLRQCSRFGGELAQASQAPTNGAPTLSGDQTFCQRRRCVFLSIDCAFPSGQIHRPATGDYIPGRPGNGS